MASPILLSLSIYVSVTLVTNVVYGNGDFLKKRLLEKSPIRRNDDVRVSWKECNLHQAERLDCGHYGIGEEQCYERECCWGESETEGVPWCYHSKPTLKKNCASNPADRVECGYYGMRKEQCLAMKCCWQPSSVPDAPWCYHTIRIPIYEGECGVPAIPPQVLSRVVGGDEAKPHSWPWMASLQVDGVHFCGGSLVNNQWVISAAHCEEGFTRDNSSVVLGLHSQSESDSPQQSFQVVETIAHEVYGTAGVNGLSSDILLIKLDRPVEFNDYISPVCLPDSGQELVEGRHCYVTGWGNLQQGGEAPDKLQQAMTPIVGPEQCNSTTWNNGTLDETMICSGYEEGGRGSCHGDSGGPLVCYEDDHWTMFGVVSWGMICAGSRYPGVYNKVSMFTDWLEITIAEN